MTELTHKKYRRQKRAVDTALEQEETKMSMERLKETPFGTMWSYQGAIYLHVRESCHYSSTRRHDRPTRWFETFYYPSPSSSRVTTQELVELTQQRSRHCIHNYFVLLDTLRRYGNDDVVSLLFEYILLVY